jgi:hypothetical protein
MCVTDTSALHCACHPQLGGALGQAGFAMNPAQAAALSAYQMRVSVDKGRQTEFDHAFVAEDTTAKDHADEVMRRCEEVTKMLRKTLGKHTDGDRCGAGSRGRQQARAGRRPAALPAARVLPTLRTPAYAPLASHSSGLAPPSTAASMSTSRWSSRR